MEESENLERLREISGRLTDTEFLLAQANALLAAIFNGADEAILSKDFDGTITAWNLAAEKFYGWTPEEAVGQNIRLIVPNDGFEELEDVMSRVQKGESVKYTTTRKRKNGTTIQVRMTVSPVVAANGSIVGASSIARPINWEWEDNHG